MKFLRTPDDRFQDLPGYDFEPHYVYLDDTEGGELRMHYVDAGPSDGPVVLMLHGEPSWSYLYRRMIKPVAAAGYRVIVPDLIGFGRSDKPTRKGDYSHARHVFWTGLLLDQLDLRDITLVCQDWGGLIGLRLVAEMEHRFAAVVAGNTMLPGFPARHPALQGVVGVRETLKAAAGFGFWFAFSQLNPFWTARQVLDMGTVRGMSAAEAAAYDAPFPDRSFMAGARVFPRLVPSDMARNRSAWTHLMEWEKPFLCAFSSGDPIMSSLAGVFPALVPGCAGQPHTTIERAGHFLQEDAGEEFATIILDFMNHIRE